MKPKKVETSLVDPKRLRTKQVAEFFSCSTQMVGKWKKEYGLMPNTDGSYDLQTCIKWREKFVTDGLKARAVDDNSPALERKRAADAAQSEFKLEVLRGRFLDKRQVEDRTVRQIHSVRRGLMSAVKVLPAEFAGETDANKIADRLDEFLIEVCNDFAASE